MFCNPCGDKRNIFMSFPDIDECVDGNACQTNAYCRNNPGNYSCLCKNGYTGDGFTCISKCLYAESLKSSMQSFLVANKLDTSV